MIFAYILGSIVYIYAVTYINHNIAVKFYSDKLITKDTRKVEDYSGAKHWILFLLNSMQVGLMVYFAMRLYQSGSTYLYAIESVSPSELCLFFIQVLFMLFVFDTNFYWLHRFAHKRSVFKYLHLDHHHYKFPTAWAAHYMSPHDMLLTTSLPMLWVVLLGVPISIPAYFTALLMANFINSAGHDGHEISRTLLALPTISGWAAYVDPKRRWVARLFNTVTHHDLHHQKVVYNYSLYFTFWDVLMGTTYADTDKIYNETVGPRT